jgi:hypothetical protein
MPCPSFRPFRKRDALQRKQTHNFFTFYALTLSHRLSRYLVCQVPATCVKGVLDIPIGLPVGWIGFKFGSNMNPLVYV